MNNVVTEISGSAAAVLTPAQQAGLDDPDLLQQCVVEIPMGSSLRRIGLGLSGMYCAACAITIEDALRKVPGVTEVQVQATSQRARILVNPAAVKLSELVAAVQDAGYRAWPDAAARAGHERLRERRVLMWRLSVAAFCMMQVMMITWPQYVAGQDEIPADLWNLMNWACWVLSLPVMLFSCGPFLQGAWRAARRGRVSMDTPVSLGILGTFIVSTGVTFGNQDLFGHEAYFDSLTMFVTFLLAGRWLESRARERVTQSLESMCVRLPEAVERAVNAEEDLSTVASESTPLSSLRHGDRVRVAVGQAFPADGQILAGETEVDESLLTGESRAVPRQVGQMVVAGSLNMSAPVWMAIERLGPDTRYQQIVSLVHQAMTEKPGWMRFADRMAAPFLWGVILLAAGGALAWQWIDPSKSVWVAVSVLVVTCPCALSLAAPSALLAAAGAMARKGLLVRRLDALEALAEIDQVYFDKTGTLTEGELSVVSLATPQGRIAAAQGLPAAQIEHWGLAAALASYSQHPLSRSLVKAAQDAGGWPATSWVDVREQAGKGVQATDAQGRVWRLGLLSWVLPAAAAEAGWWTQDSDARVWMAAIDDTGTLVPETVTGFVFDEVFRAEARPTVQRLRELGCQSALLSGDQASRVHAAARLLGQGEDMVVAQAQATPEDKLNVIARIQAEGHRVAVVGDGINDAPVLAKADVSVALDQGAALAQSQADLIILGGRLLGLPEAVVISRQAMRIVRQNLAWAAIYNASCIPLALAGLMPPWLAGLGMALSSLGVVLNALRLGGARA
ncbi:cation-translocating P-type ATPase [Aquabacterium sp.]|jgi:Cu2+-exporting ATPase|uniref:heavy metal translocating P-type ATPase n=1 Tax=Aquabacterium sp. TaxID=1872578 RepID=UPI001B4AEA2A|nr:cation-translocating P-type ATPase [Aquabacterium sp.]MBP6615229.1 cation-translocating P-type ATPase [Aquabacterium sp.]MBP7503113.1 cation-translocating P-type ATPase [Aquabacterium sp.]MDD2977434.1 cation-translocating P-type ATPase [Aquabacterium sp.]